MINDAAGADAKRDSCVLPQATISLKGIQKPLMKTSSPFHISASSAHVVILRDAAGLETRDRKKRTNKGMKEKTPV